MAYWVTGSVVPFDDTLSSPILISSTTEPDTTTTDIDVYRQGVEITSVKYMYIGTQPKFWAGYIDYWGQVHHTPEVSINPYGQAVSFTEFYNSTIWNDVSKFDPVAYITLGSAYPAPVTLNGGPQDAEEAIIEPLTIPFRLDTNESYPYMHGVYGEYEDGNNFDAALNLSANKTEQFIEYNQPIVARYFLDEGERLIGSTFAGSIKIPNWLPNITRTLSPFTDQNNEYITSRLAASVTMFGAIANMDYGLNDEDLRDIGKRSACAGYTGYGPNYALYGTDSLAFVWRARGS
jgi:hypothetical protein